LVAFKYFAQSDWRIIVKNLELPHNVKLKTQVVTDRVPSVLSGIRAAQSSFMQIPDFFSSITEIAI
jgi:hypothetical protein